MDGVLAPIVLEPLVLASSRRLSRVTSVLGWQRACGLLAGGARRAEGVGVGLGGTDARYVRAVQRADGVGAGLGSAGADTRGIGG